MNLDNLTPEQIEKVKSLKTAEEIRALANEEGYSLSDEELEAISGGLSGWSDLKDKYLVCPKCKVAFELEKGKDFQKCPRCREVYLVPRD